MHQIGMQKKCQQSFPVYAAPTGCLHDFLISTTIFVLPALQSGVGVGKIFDNISI